METKTCSKCQETKTLDQFHKVNRLYYKYGVDYYCKYCRVGSNIKSFRSPNKKKCSVEDCNRIHYAKTWCRMHYARMDRNGQLESLTKPRDIEDPKLYHGATIRYRREYHLMSKYKMSLDEFMERAENGCEICGDKPERTLHVDHDHNCCNGDVTCGQCVRGLLCSGCNKAVDKYEVGLMRPDYLYTDRVKAYVERYNG